MTLMIRGGRVLDPATATDRILDVYVEDGAVKRIGEGLKEQAQETIDASGMYVMPGFVDMHVHLRDPGQTDKESIETGAAAAAKGGYTSIVAMPNTKPVVDNSDVLSYVLNKGRSVTPVHVYQAGAVTVGMAGEALTDLADMAAHGAIAFSEDGKSVASTKLCWDALHELARLDLPLLDHCEEKTLMGNGIINEDENCVRLGLPGIHNTVENVIASRDYLLATEAGARLHLCHCSTKEVVHMLRLAKQTGSALTAEVCPHHFTLTSDDIPDAPWSKNAQGEGQETPTLSASPMNREGLDMVNYKMNPPLRTREDRDALIEGLLDGTVDCVATDHAPHSAEEKAGGLAKSLNGIVGLECAFPVLYTALVKSGKVPLEVLLNAMCVNPRRIFRFPGGRIAEGQPADLTVLRLDRKHTVDPAEFRSRGRATPFEGWEVYGEIVMTVCNGEIVYRGEGV